MAGLGPPPLHPSIRSRRRSSKSAGFRIVAGISGEAPKWPIFADVGLVAQVDVLTRRIAGLWDESSAAADGRIRARINREINRLEPQLAQLSRQVELQESAEKALWSELWAMPQAVLWQESHSYREVAQYVRWKIRGESGDLKASVEARMLSDRLGLNPLALLRLRAEIERVDEAEHQGTQRRAARKAPAKKTAARKKPDDPRSFLAVMPPPS
jgi:hypothetical protein